MHKNNNFYTSRISHFSLWTFASCINTSLHAILNSYIKVSQTFSVICQKYGPQNILNNVGISIKLSPQIIKQQLVVSYEILRNCLFLFTIAHVSICCRKQQRPPLLVRTVLADKFNKTFNILRGVRVTNAAVKILRINIYDFSFSY